MRFILNNKVYLTTVIIGVVSWLMWSVLLGGIITGVGLWLMAKNNGFGELAFTQWGTYGITAGMLGYYYMDSTSTGILFLLGGFLYISGFVTKNWKKK